MPIAASAGAFVITTCEGKQRVLSCYGALRTEMSRGRVWCVHNSRHASEMGISVAVHQHTSTKEGKAKKLRTGRFGIKNAGSMFWMPGVLPDRDMGEDGSPDQAERWPVKSLVLVSTAIPNTTHPLLVTAMARDCCL